LPADLPAVTQVLGVAVEADGGLWAYVGSERDKGRVLYRQGQGPWKTLVQGLDVSSPSRLTLDPRGGVFVGEETLQGVFHLQADGTREDLAGTGEVGFGGDGGPAAKAALDRPSGLWCSPDRQLYICDSGNGLIRKIDLAAGTISTVAGAYGLTQQGEGSAIAINGPAGLAVDGQGRLLMAEAASSTIKRLDGSTLSVMAGTTRGFAGDNGPAASCKLNTPIGLAYDQGTLYVSDSLNSRVRAISPTGVITTIAGGGSGLDLAKVLAPAIGASMEQLSGIAVGPDHLPYWVDGGSSQVLRLTADGQVEVLAGALDRTPGDQGDDGPAAGAMFSKPLGIAVDARGDVYVADTGNMRVRRIAMSEPGRPIHTFAGLPKAAVISALLSKSLPDGEGKQAKDVPIFAPAGLCFDAAGNLYLTELGTSKLGTLFAGSEAALADLPRVGSRIRKIAPDGTITTIAGAGTGILDVNQDDALNNPLGLLIDNLGRLVIADSGNNQVKLLPKGSF